jgi:hypothetical protein
MPNFIIKIVLVTLFFNIAAGIVMATFPYFTENPEFTGGIGANDQFNRDMITKLNQSVDTSKIVDSSSTNTFNRLVDLLNIGMIDRFLQAITFGMYGLVIILQKSLGGLLPLDLAAAMFSIPFGFMATIINIGYTYSAWTMWTGRYTGE